MVDLDVVDRLLGAPPDLHTWRVADMANRKGILGTWLSSAVARGLELSEAEGAYLRRWEQRVETLHATGVELADRYQATVLKGPAIARFYPDGLLRQSGDVDLFAPSQDVLWSCVRDLVDRRGAVPQGVSILEGPEGVHVGVAMKWPAAEPHLDKPMGADVTTFTFAGDLRGVPVRIAPVAEEDLCGLFAVAEERFQRKFRIKDLLDLLVLAEILEQRLGDDLTEVICEHAARLALAPELRQLIVRASEWVSMSERWRRTADALRPLARREKDLRRPDRQGVHRLSFGMPLDERPGAPSRVDIHRRAGSSLVTTPVGTCLLTERLVVNEDELTDALDHARSLTAPS
ncbi:nucleotidyltransferase family protein [Micromonospora peucetia]|uniref:Uncharacterized nucleotidyltransferase n=1 Tax=Micromonospora peucetia TaxID=47871 RepID=A0A1C6W2W6_9ACTN|nr:nucleotidyltransferase family protein [Micromonospora peucetia]MCX4391243.1 nucleotidyltransferase family protein [Micromonospora peucetia]SCL72878.1 Uncharacterised nucleotidyltransferase [Micromonospora peucetia]